MFLSPEPEDLSFLDVPLEADPDDQITGSYEREVVQASRVDPVTFGEYAFQWRSRPLHDEWQDLCTTYHRLVIFAPTEHGKSMQISVLRIIWELGRNTNLRIVLLSSTSTLSCKNLGLLKQAILLNPRVRKVFPRLRRERRPGRTQAWWTDAIIVERDDLLNKDFSVQALGLHGSIEGSRVDLMTIDDMLDMENTRTEAQRQLTIDYLRSTGIPRLTPSSRLWAVGTPWYDTDAMHWLEANEEYHGVRYDAEAHLWPELEVVGGKECGWPEERLRQREREIGTIEYNRSMRCRALTDIMKIFPMAQVDQCFALDGRTSFAQEFRDPSLWVMTGVDLGVKKKVTANETIFFTVGLSRSGLFYVINVTSGRMEIMGILRMMVDIWRRYGPSVFVVENVAAQDYIVQFVRNPKEVLEAIGVMGVESALSQIRVEPFTTGSNKDDPMYGIRAMTADWEQLKWRVPRTPETLKWREEMDRFTPAGHPGDRIMASWFVWSRLRERARMQKIRARTVGGKIDVDQAQAPAGLVQRPRIRAR